VWRGGSTMLHKQSVESVYQPMRDEWVPDGGADRTDCHPRVIPLEWRRLMEPKASERDPE
jgi:hypothetical protein